VDAMTNAMNKLRPVKWVIVSDSLADIAASARLTRSCRANLTGS
jgi:hypothetical protein